jgi:cell division protein FtsZ
MAIYLERTNNYLGNEKQALLRVVGVGGGGCNALDDMIMRGLSNVDYIGVNTDVQALNNCTANYKVQVGKNLTRGLGAGSDPTVGARAVEEDKDEIIAALTGSDMVYVTAGMGGGTGTGGAPIVANIAKSTGALVVGVVTKPFSYEGKSRMQQAEEGIEELRKYVDTLIVIPNQRLLSLYVDKKATILEAFTRVNQVLYESTQGISEIISEPGIINIDFNDVRTIMTGMGDALMGAGTGKGEHRAVEAANTALSSPLLEGTSISGAQGILVNVKAGLDTSLQDFNEAVTIIAEAAGSEAKIIAGLVLTESMNESMTVTLIATGFGPGAGKNRKPAQAQSRQQTPAFIPTNIQGWRELDLPASTRRTNLDLMPSKNGAQDDQGERIKKANPDKPALLRRIID